MSTYIYFLTFLMAGVSFGQISPGDLSMPHANLEGMSNCTLCHDLGAKVSDKKCLECHTEVQSLINRKKGYHAQGAVIKKDCYECHNEHHGRNFELIRFDEDAFNHDQTGYQLEGKHQEVDCRECHISDNIADRDLKKRKNTFLGLDEECLSCHDDYHQQTLASDCLECHEMEGFASAPKFVHNETDFALKGAHETLDCTDCHKGTTRNGREFQEFANVAFNDCVSCHEDPHGGKIQGSCTQCHTESSFGDFRGKGRFDHRVTSFELKGKHASIDCFSCHRADPDPMRVFQDQPRVEERQCVSCHTDVHDGAYGNDCVKCHRETSFLSLRSMDFFDHTKTDYPLQGKHSMVDCRQCHTQRFSTPIDFSACSNCHQDYHEGEFRRAGGTPDCAECHSLENGFDYSLYTLEQHRESRFPLEGAHTATPCYACHVSEEKQRWTFRELGTGCADCHSDIHQGFINEKYYPGDDCAVCHGNDAWTSVSFDHDQTQWPLDGKHREVSCRECHFNEIKGNVPGGTQKFATLSTDCADCHENIHGETFAIQGVTDCARCHVTESWFPKRFDHNRTNFPLEGKHAKIACSACHEVTSPGGETEVIYKLGKFRCIDCHL